MTNGEKIKETFPNLRITEFESYICVMGENYEFNNAYPKKWWNAEYKEPSSLGNPNNSENPISSTTKKCTTCAYREIDGKPHEMCKCCVCGNRYRDDAISRKEVLKIIDQIQDAGGFIGYNTCSAAFDVINNMPPVTPIRPKGHWIDTNNLDAKYKAIYMCSNCRSCYTEMKPINMNYCPNCGSDNREVEE